MWKSLTSDWRRHAKAILTSLRTDVFFWLSLALGLAGLLVPQIRTVTWQAVKGPGLLAVKSVRDVPTLLSSNSTWQAAGFLAYLALMATLLVTAILFVVPPSFLATADNPGKPIKPPPTTRRRTTAFVLILLALLPFFVLLPVPPLILIALTVLLLFRPVGLFVRAASGWLVRVAESTPHRVRTWAGVALLASGLLVAFLSLGARGHESRLYPLAGSACQLFGGLGLLVGFWLVTIPREVIRKKEEGGSETYTPLGTVRTAQGRLLGWLIGVCLFGEVVWILAYVPGANLYFSYRLYTIWAALTIPAILIVTASLLDTWDFALNNPEPVYSYPVPVRLVGIVFAALLFLYVAPPEVLEATPAPDGQALKGDDWPNHLLARVRTIEKGEPVLLVAAAGGGSRAAIFAGLVLESLAREPFPGGKPNDTWANHVVLISGVSGGSLGTATFVQRLDKLAVALRPGAAATADEAVARDDLRNSVKSELLARMAEWADEIVKESESSDKTDRLAAARAVQAKCQQLLGDHPPREWVLHSAVMDDLCTDFMAPIFRGALTPGISRGESIRHFWAERFQWGNSTDRGGYARAGTPIPFDPAVHPLILLNATDVRRGCRLAVGFPPLPQGLLKEYVAPSAKSEKRIEGPRNPPETLADVHRDRVVGLAQAVGLSANFPFGFNATTIPRFGPESDDDPTAKVLDGGILDNTGIDSIFWAIKAIEARANEPGAKGVYVELWNELRDRRIVLVEIDSGAKPEKAGPATTLLSVLLDPLAGLNNASFTSAALAKRSYLVGLQAAFRVKVDLSKELAALGDGEEARPSLLEIQNTGVDRFGPLKYDANHFDGANVLTAWSLAPDDKALLLVRFLLELELVKGNLDDVARWPRRTLAQEEAEARKQASQLVAQRQEERARVRLEKALAGLKGDLVAIEQLQKDDLKSADKLLPRLRKVEVSIDQAVKEYEATPRARRNESLDKQLQALQASARDSRVRLEKGQRPTAAMYDALTMKQQSPYNAALGSLANQKEQLKKRAEDVLDKVNPQGKLLKEYNKHTRESRELFDVPPAAKKDGAAPPREKQAPK